MEDSDNSDHDGAATGCQNLNFSLVVEFAMHGSELLILASFLFYVVYNYYPYLGDSVRKTLRIYFLMQVTRTASAGVFALCVAYGQWNDSVNSNWTQLQLVDSLIQILMFLGSFIVFYYFLLKLKTVQIQIDPRYNSPEQILDQMVKVQARSRYITLVVVGGFLAMILSTVIFSAFDLYQQRAIQKVGALLNLCICLPSVVTMTYFLWYFVKMGDDYVKILSLQYENVSTFKYRLFMGGIAILIASGWANSVMIYIYLPIVQLVFDGTCTMDFLRTAQKLLILGWIQPTLMGIFMLIIILFFAKDEKARMELRYSMEAQGSADAPVDDDDSLYDSLANYDEGIAEEEQEQIQQQAYDYMRRNHSQLQKNKAITSYKVHQVHEDFRRRRHVQNMNNN
jgi:hypothetical protein